MKMKFLLEIISLYVQIVVFIQHLIQVDDYIARNANIEYAKPIKIGNNVFLLQMFQFYQELI